MPEDHPDWYKILEQRSLSNHSCTDDTDHIDVTDDTDDIDVDKVYNPDDYDIDEDDDGDGD